MWFLSNAMLSTSISSCGLFFSLKLTWISRFVLLTTISWVLFGARETCHFSPPSRYLCESVTFLCRHPVLWAHTKWRIFHHPPKRAQYASLRDTYLDAVVSSVFQWELLLFVCGVDNFSKEPGVRRPLQMLLICLTNLGAMPTKGSLYV